MLLKIIKEFEIVILIIFKCRNGKIYLNSKEKYAIIYTSKNIQEEKAMSEFGRRNTGNENRFDVVVLKLKVMLGLFLFEEIEVEIDKNDFNICIEREMKNWCKSKGIKISITDVDRPMYITGRHSVYKLDTMRHCKRISFSR